MSGGVEVWSHRQMMCKVGMKQSQRADSVSQLMVRWNQCKVQSVGSRYERRGEASGLTCWFVVTGERTNQARPCHTSLETVGL